MKKCRSCQKEIDAKATKCPFCQTKQGNWAQRHPIWTIILGIFVFGMFSSAIGGSKNSQGTPTGSAQSLTSATSKPSTPSHSDLMKQNDPDIKHLSKITADYVGKSFTLYANAKTADYYNYGFDNENLYYSLQLRDDSISSTFDYIYAYIPKSDPNSKILVEKLLNGEAFLKIEASIPKDKYRQGSNAFLQVNSWEEVQ